MYRGVITEIGEIRDWDDRGLEVRAPKTIGALEIGGSVNVAGVCLCVEALADEAFRCAVSSETRTRSRLDTASVGDRVNVEIPMRVGDPLDGHLVQGHVDAVGKVVKVDEIGISRRLWIRPPTRLRDDLVAKGSIAVDGVSLTVAEIVRDRFSVVLIPATLDATTLGGVRVGDRVDLESDVVGKLAHRHGAATATALRRAVDNLPWAGVQTGRQGIEKLVGQFAAGGAVIVWDPDREGEGDIVIAGSQLRPEHMTFVLTQACCHPTVPCASDVLDRLEIPPMPGPGDKQGTAMYTPVDLKAGTTGVSAAERAATVRRLANPDAGPDEFEMPGHVFPLAARPGRLGERRGHTEAGVALCEAAGFTPVALICEVMAPDGTMAGAAELERFALHWGLPIASIDDLAAWL